MKKVLVIGYYHLKNDKRVFRTVKALSRKSVVLYQYLSDNEKEINYGEENINFVPVFFKIDPKENIIKKAIKRIKFDLKIMKIIKKENYDILYMHHFLPIFPLEPFKIAKKRNKVLIYDIHEYHPENFLSFLKGLLKRLKEKIMLKIFEKQIKLSDKLVFVSKEIQEDIFKTLSINKPYLIVPNYAHFSVSAKEKKKEIVLVGKTPRNIEREKEIIKRLISYGFKFKIIGIDSEHFKDIPHEYTSFLPYEDMMKGLSK
ncbi:MAG TPA: glycosyl transferase family 1, partial [Thermosipho africanus]|nr:glycosyl transferase family 1 [Thermosipho africanus]